MNVNTQGAGMDARQLARIGEHLQQRYLEPGKVAGFVPVVCRRGYVAYCEPLGYMDLERAKPMREDTLFRIYSMTKPITSIAMMMLYEAGHFQLNDPVHRFIPAWRDLRVFEAGNWPHFATRPVERAMTIKDLFTHMSGLSYDFMQRTNVDRAYRRLGVRNGGEAGTLEGMVKLLAELPLEFSPGTRWNYSFSTDILGYLVEVISGERFDRFLETRIFEPLGMHDTGFHVPQSKLDRFAANYERGADKRLQLLDDPLESDYGQPRRFFSGGGGLVSTAADYLRFCRMLLGGGTIDGVKIVGPKTLELMSRNHLPDDDDLTRWAAGSFSETSNEGYGFGLGFSVNLGPARTASVGSAGEIAWGGAASTIFFVDPKEDLTCILMTQFMPSGTFNFRGQMKALVYPAIEP